MKRKSCLGLNTKKSYTTWQITLQNKIDNMTMGGPLAYSLEVVPGTNIFLGIKKKSTKRSIICHSCPIKANGDVSQCQQDDHHCHCPCYLSTGFALCKNTISEDRYSQA
ncbi:hypothetical protein NP493_519g04008 [Ridgeia piscesae]|uniref:Uncharacterized protein n=1 Tax=Ridgeia piscesae TaxID=27915 RepID=A0AAD9KX15_RIDPI|nr:hypothetical protein NP493_519g04008 [Ridgeia piscesae]